MNAILFISIIHCAGRKVRMGYLILSLVTILQQSCSTTIIWSASAEDVGAIIIGDGRSISNENESDSITGIISNHSSSSSSSSTLDISDEMVKQRVLNHARKAAQETVASEDIANITKEIQELKQKESSAMLLDLERQARIQLLEDKRVLLLRQGMLQKQFQMPKEHIKTASAKQEIN